MARLPTGHVGRPPRPRRCAVPPDYVSSSTPAGHPGQEVRGLAAIRATAWSGRHVVCSRLAIAALALNLDYVGLLGNTRQETHRRRPGQGDRAWSDRR